MTSIELDPAKSKALIVAGLVVLCLNVCGCDNLSKPQIIALPQPRFQVIGQATGVALDTKTGLLCHTYNELTDTYVGKVSADSTALPHPSFDSVPLCVDLSQKEKETIDRTLQADHSIAVTYRKDGSGPVFTVTTPNGMVWQFQDIESAQKFRKIVLKTP